MDQTGHELLEAYVRQHAERAWRLAVGLMGNPDDAEDVVQDAFLTVAKMIDRVPGDRPWPWLATVIVNAARNAQRKRTRRRRNVTQLDGDFEPEDTGVATPAEDIADMEMAAAVREELSRLPAEEREALSATHLSGMSQSEAAEALGMPLGTVKTRVRRGLEMLRARLGRRLNRPGWGENAGDAQASDQHHAAIAKALAVMVVAEPAGGLGQAVVGWTAAAKVGLPLAGAGAGTAAAGTAAGTAGAGAAGATGTVAATGGVLVMSKAMMVSVVSAALVIGLGVGAVGLGPVVAGGRDTPVVSGRNAAEEGELAELRARMGEREAELRKAGEALAEERRLRGQRESDWQELGRELAGLKGAVQAKDAEIAEMRRGMEEMGRALGAAKATEAPKPAASTVDAATARVKARGIVEELRTLLEGNIGNGTKEAVLKKLRELASLGLATADEYYEAYLMVGAKGSPYEGKNELDLSASEFHGILPWEFVIHALTDGHRTAPAAIKNHGLFWHVQDPTIPRERALAVVGGELDQANPETAATAIHCLSQMRSAEALPYLSRAAGRGLLPPEVRAKAVMAMAERAGEVEMRQIEALADDASTVVADAALFSLNLRKPPATGLLVSAVENGKPASLAGMRVGDVVTRFNGAAVTDAASIQRAVPTDGTAAEVQVVVLRRGQTVTLTMTVGPEKSGFSGRPVVKGE